MILQGLWPRKTVFRFALESQKLDDRSHPGPRGSAPSWW